MSKIQTLLAFYFTKYDLENDSDFKGLGPLIAHLNDSCLESYGQGVWTFDTETLEETAVPLIKELRKRGIPFAMVSFRS